MKKSLNDREISKLHGDIKNIRKDWRLKENRKKSRDCQERIQNRQRRVELHPSIIGSFSLEFFESTSCDDKHNQVSNNLLETRQIMIGLN